MQYSHIHCPIIFPTCPDSPSTSPNFIYLLNDQVNLAAPESGSIHLAPLKKTDSSFLPSKLPTVSSSSASDGEVRGSSWTCLSSMLECWLVWSCIGLLQTAVVAVGSWMPQWFPYVQKTLFTLVLPKYLVFKTLCPQFLDIPWALWGQPLYRYPICGWALCWHLVSVHWSVVNMLHEFLTCFGVAQKHLY